MIPQELIHRLDLRQFPFQHPPIRLQHLTGSKSQDLTDEGEHPRSEGEDSRLPSLHVLVAAMFSPLRGLVF